MGSRTWIKIFCDSWFEGSIRQESTLVRSVFTDLLALAGRLGETGTISLPGGIFGYTDEQIAVILNITTEEWVEAKDHLSNHPENGENRILVDERNRISIINWERYQSEYEKRRDRNRNLVSRHNRTDKIAAHLHAVNRTEKIAAAEGEGEKKEKEKREEVEKKEKEKREEVEQKKSKSLSSDKSDDPPPSISPPELQLQGPSIEDQKSKPRDLAILWNDLCTKLPQVKVDLMSDQRMKKARLRLKQAPIEYWRSVFEKINATPFLVGKGSSGWKADFDWIIKNEENADKVMSGIYGPPKLKYKVVSTGDENIFEIQDETGNVFKCEWERSTPIPDKLIEALLAGARPCSCCGLPVERGFYWVDSGARYTGFISEELNLSDRLEYHPGPVPEGLCPVCWTTLDEDGTCPSTIDPGWHADDAGRDLRGVTWAFG